MIAGLILLGAIVLFLLAMHAYNVSILHQVIDRVEELEEKVGQEEGADWPTWQGRDR